MASALTLGRMGYLGSLDDVMYMCGELEFLRPCLDFAHIYAQRGGGLAEKGDFREIFDRLKELEGRLRLDEIKGLHCHFYPIEYGESGEKSHKNYKEGNYGPRFEPFRAPEWRCSRFPSRRLPSSRCRAVAPWSRKAYYYSL